MLEVEGRKVDMRCRLIAEYMFMSIMAFANLGTFSFTNLRLQHQIIRRMGFHDRV